jgi:membrane fusion protein, multidrug efflux system
MEDSRKESSPGRIIAGGIFILIAIVAGIVLLFFRQNKGVAGERDKRADAFKNGPVVKVSKATKSGSTHELVLIGEVRPFRSVTLYSKISGYLKRILVDKGDKVAEGQLIAEVITPEIDQEYNSALADLDNKKRILGRDKSLLDKQYISSQEKEQSETDVKIAEARVNSVRQQQQYKYLKAPFSGTITARYADPGALVQNATNASTGALPVVNISQLDKVRIYVYVEQRDAGFLKNDYPVVITMSEKPDVKIEASITRISGELDPKTRMMLTEIDLSNTTNQVIPGSYVQVHILSPDDSHLQIPRGALVIKEGKYFVLKVGADSTIHFSPIRIGENTGDLITVLEGLTAEDALALDIGESLEDGQKIRIQK